MEDRVTSTLTSDGGRSTQPDEDIVSDRHGRNVERGRERESTILWTFFLVFLGDVPPGMTDRKIAATPLKMLAANYACKKW